MKIDPATVMEIPVERIKRNPLNPRTDVGDITDLAASMAAVGLLQPIVLMQDGDDFLLLAGERRTEAARALAWMMIPGRVLEERTEVQQLEILLIENLQREDIRPTDEARAFQHLCKAGDLSQRQVAERVGCDQSHVSRRMELLKLSPEDQQAVDSGKLTVSKALKSLKPKPKKAPEPVTVPDSMRPDPVDALEPLGWAVVAYDAEGKPQLEVGEMFFDPIVATEKAIEEAGANGYQTIPVALVPLQLPTTWADEGPPQVDSESVGEEPSTSEGEVTQEVEEEGPAGAVAEDDEVAAPLVTVSPAQGEYNQHIVTCSEHGRIGGYQDPQVAVGMADRHIAALHEVGTLLKRPNGSHPSDDVAQEPAPEDQVDEPDEELKTRLVDFAKTWGGISAADERTVRESAVHEFGNDIDVERAMKLWSAAREKLAKAS